MPERTGRSLADPSLMTEELPVAPPRAGGERLDSQVQKAQEQLLKLKREQEAIEKQKRELEELSRRQEELESGRAEMIEKLTRSLVIVERQSVEAQKRVETLRATNDSFVAHLQALEAINPKSWPSGEMQRELSRALSMVDHARSEFNQQRSRFASEAVDGSGDAGTGGGYEDVFAEHDHSFLYWLKAGVAFTLPMLLLGLIALAILCWRTVSGLP